MSKSLLLYVYYVILGTLFTQFTFLISRSVSSEKIFFCFYRNNRQYECSSMQVQGVTVQYTSLLFYFYPQFCQ